MEFSHLHIQMERACRRLLSEQNRDPHAPAYGCFDRRYWAWKLVDFPEATFQRNVLVLAWRMRGAAGAEREVLAEAVRAGLAFAAASQHADGSWDQAFPHEHSFGATAFLLHPLLEGFLAVRDTLPDPGRTRAEASLRRAADFLCGFGEEHGHIANHLAGAVLSLVCAGDEFGEPRYHTRADELLASVLDRQAGEGWFVEYEGADPGYQTLCLYYLAHVQRRRPSARLEAALERAVVFLSWFVHPDGTFGGEYGSRRTAVFYPGGFALLAERDPVAAAVLGAMLRSVRDGRTLSLDGVDAGNLAPLASNYVAVLDAGPALTNVPPLPCEREDAAADFPGAGLFVRGACAYYAVLGASNGGVLKVFSRAERRALWNDGGYVGRDASGGYVTTQVTDLTRSVSVRRDEIRIEAPFYRMPRALPTPGRFLPLRLLNLTAMRSVRVGNAVKRGLVRMLIRAGKPAPLALERTVRFEAERVVVRDVVRSRPGVRLRWLEYGRPFVAIHMASARYYENADTAATVLHARRIEVERLSRDGEVQVEVVV
jgi:hypothetical protein